ncbi:glycosyltransferase family 39 protein [Spirillospora sp. NPDC048911]|uniref:glycosyltransferase family 39 protein n=1 Tax=Spirillospora sp. NPDC048911 TaxID=3364527 RepID=UPI0037239BB5
MTTIRPIATPQAEAPPGEATGQAPERNRITRLFLGRPEDPAWVRPVLWGVLLIAGALYAWGMSASGYANSYYSAAVKSGTQSWSAFFFGSLDTGDFITVDKPPMALWAQELFGRVFGFGTFSLLFPEVLMGVAAVAVLYTTVRRAFGYKAALVAAVVLTLTPITVAINRDNNPDTMLVLFLVLAAWAVQRSIESGRVRWLLASAFFVGCGFNTKMLQAYLVVPALALAYLVAAKPGLLRRIGHLLGAGAVLAASSFWWMLIVDLIPAKNRPYIGGSTDNTVWDLVIGYNGLGRIFGQGGGPGGGRGGGGGGASFGGASGVGRLFNDILGGQISWLLPFAAIALVAGLVLAGRRPRADLARAALLIWGGWLIVHYLVFSLAEGTFHPYYSTAMAPAIAALTGAGGGMLYEAGKRSAAWAWVLPAGVAVTGAWSFVLLDRTPGWNPWLRWVVVACTVVAVLLFAAGRVGGVRRPAALAALVVALVAGLAGPGAYAVSAASTAANGTNPLAGPSSGSGFGGPGGGMRGGMPGEMPGGMPPGMRSGQAPFGGQPPTGQAPTGQQQSGQRANGQRQDGGGFRGGFGGGFGGGMRGQVDTKMVSYLEQHRGNAQWLVAVGSAQQASSLILETGEPVIAMGGFSGSDAAMTVAKLQEYVKAGKLRYILISGEGRGGPGGGGSTEVTAWVKKNGTLVDPSTYGGSSSSTSDGGAQLYHLG